MNFSKTTKYGLLIALALIIYFIIIDLIGLGNESWLSFFNAAIVGFGLWQLIKKVYEEKRGQFKYMEGFTASLTAGFIATTIFTVFMAIYLFEIHPELATELKQQITIAGEGLEVALLLFVFLSGVATTIVASLVILPIYKQSWNTKEIRSKQKPLNQQA
ncbi:DUF4199 domain-containing protein [Nonlabens tegetincola]|uniref:DUF4199 domain-containing protein n=1 Tax=Nonlabens tegetincola TaxID=323273 RepID=UPI000D479953|nr:DUF4199 domain-containing protein [Nonlabens tegetincola]PQJ20269.1 hypothetical protein BST93_02155 [Nonlabens tegetincola]